MALPMALLDGPLFSQPQDISVHPRASLSRPGTLSLRPRNQDIAVLLNAFDFRRSPGYGSGTTSLGSSSSGHSHASFQRTEAPFGSSGSGHSRVQHAKAPGGSSGSSGSRRSHASVLARQVGSSGGHMPLGSHISLSGEMHISEAQSRGGGTSPGCASQGSHIYPGSRTSGGGRISRGVAYLNRSLRGHMSLGSRISPGSRISLSEEKQKTRDSASANRCASVENEKARPGIHLTFCPDGRPLRKFLRVALASPLLGLEVCVRLAKACPAACVFLTIKIALAQVGMRPAACVCQPPVGHFFDIRPSRMAPAQVRDGRRCMC